LKTWLDKYVQQAPTTAVSYISVQYNPEEPFRATLNAKSKYNIPAGILPYETAEDYFLFAKPQSGQGVQTGHFRQVGRVVFRAEFPELMTLDLENMARRIERSDSSWTSELLPAGLPRKELSEVAKRVKQLVMPNLQRRDDEGEGEYRTRTLARAWLLDLFTFVVKDLERLSVTVRGVSTKDEPFQFELKAKSKRGAIPRLLGQQARKKSGKLAAIREQPAIATLAYDGTLPQTLRKSLQELVGTVSDEKQREALSEWVEQSTSEAVLKIDTVDGRVVLFGGIRCDGAQSIVRTLAEASGQPGERVIVKQNSKDSTATASPSHVGIVANGPAILFAMSDGPVDAKLAELERMTLRSGNATRLVELDLSCGKLANLERATGLDNVPALMIDVVELLVHHLGVMRARGRMVMNPSAGLEAIESLDDVPSVETYLQLIGQNEAMSGSFDPRKHSVRSSLKGGESRLQFQIDTTSDELRIRGKVGRGLYRFVVGRLFATSEGIVYSRD
jgi:hypothetical protein